MALNKAIDTDYGVAATYWRITGAQVYYDDGLIDVVLAGYASDAARHANKTPLATLSGVRLSWSDMALAEGAEPSREAVYAAIKAKAAEEGSPLAILADATDC